MNTRLIILFVTAALLSSCEHYQVKSAQQDRHECYSTWQPYPHNS